MELRVACFDRGVDTKRFIRMDGGIKRYGDLRENQKIIERFEVNKSITLVTPIGTMATPLDAILQPELLIKTTEVG